MTTEQLQQDIGTGKLPVVSIIIPCYNGGTYIKPCIQSFLDSTLANMEIIIVNDASTDQSFTQWKKTKQAQHPSIRIIEHLENQGFVGACTTAFKASTADYVFLMNVDATLEKDTMRKLYDVIAHDTTVGGVIPWFRHEGVDARDNEYKRQRIIGQYSIVGGHGLVDMRAYVDPAGQEHKEAVDLFYTGALILRRDSVKYLFKQEYVCYGEDVDLCWRLRLQGLKVLIHLDAKGHHVGGSALVEKRMSDRAVYHGTKNRITNFLVYYSKNTLWKVLPLLVLNECTILLGQSGRAKLRWQSYTWIAKNRLQIKIWRTIAQYQRKVPDQQILNSLSYKFNEPSQQKNAFIAVAYRLLNACAWAYCKLVRLKTAEEYSYAEKESRR